MPVNTIITTLYKNEKVKLIYSESFQLLERDSIIDVQLQGFLGFKLQFCFKRELSNRMLTNIDISNEAGVSTFIFTCTNWFSDNWIELIDPYYFETIDKSVRGYIKFKASGNTLANFRTVNFDIWQIIAK